MTARLGRFEFPNRGESPQDACVRYDQIAQAPSATTRHYLGITQSMAGSFTQWSLEHNRVPVIAQHSWSEQPRHAIAWADVADGRFDGQIQSDATELLSLIEATGATVPAWVGWHHEPENEENGKTSGDLPAGEHCGTAAECKAAGERYLGLVKAALGDKVRVGQTLMAGSYKSGRYKDWLPANAWWAGVDGYSHGNAKETFGAIFDASHAAATSGGYRLMIQEIGAEEIAGTSFKANFMAEARATIKGWSECRVVEWSNVQAKGDYTIDSSPESLSAFRAWAADSYYRGTWT